MNANDFIVKNAPERINYIPNFINENEEKFLLEKIYSCPKPKWENLSNRRLQQWGGIVGKKGLIADNNMPLWLSNIITKVCTIKNAFEDKKPNHILINEYLPGQGILPHTDGPVFWPLICTISLNSHTILSFYENDKTNMKRSFIGSMLLEPRSLILITKNAYEHFHGIDEVFEDNINNNNNNIFNISNKYLNETKLKRSKRVSLTIRHVPIVNKNLFSSFYK